MKCFFCEQVFHSFNYLKLHIRITHSLTPNDAILCNLGICQRSFSNIRSLYAHINKNHNKELLVEIESVEIENNGYDDDSEDFIENANPGEFSKNYNTEDLEFVLKLYSKLHITRSDIDNFIQSTIQLFYSKNLSHKCSLSSFDTEYKRRQIFLQEKLLIESLPIVMTQLPSRDCTVETVNAQFFKLSQIFHCLFQNPVLLDLAQNYMKSNNNFIGDIKDGTKFCNLPPDTFPFILFFDEMETGNSLGSKKGIHKMGMIYASLRCFPPHLYSKLKNIFACALFLSSEARYSENLLNELVHDINNLQSVGIMVNSTKIFFKFIGITGDNLGLHQIMKFVESFSANYCCRFCKIHKTDRKYMTVECTELLRNEVTHNEDLDRDVSESGLNGNSILNNIDGYHVTRNDIVDLMHDVFEGIANYGMAEILSYYISNDTISIDLINASMKNFKFINGSRPPPLKMKNIAKKDLSLSASEMINYVLHFGMMVGNYIPSNCEVWAYYICLRDIVNLSLFKEISMGMINYFQNLISEHHQLYLKLFNTTLKPKHHHLTHYPRIMRKLGPLPHFWGMRFEGKNLEFKHIATTCRSRVNLCKSLAVRNSFANAANLYFSRQMTKYYSPEEIGTAHDKSNNTFKWVIYDGVKYSLGNYVCCYENEENMPSFGIIRLIHVLGDQVEFQLQMQETVYYSAHVGAYCVETLEEIIKLDPNSVSNPLPVHISFGEIIVGNIGL